MMSDSDILGYARQFVNMSDPMCQALKEQFRDAEVRYAGTTVTDGHDVHFAFRCKSKRLYKPWILAVHLIALDNGYLLNADVVEEETQGIWWKCEPMKSSNEALAQHIGFFMGALFSGSGTAIQRWIDFRGDCNAMQIQMVMDS